jgi:hypothetical protein
MFTCNERVQVEKVEIIESPGSTIKLDAGIIIGFI